MPQKRALVAGNWKMNGLAAALAEIAAMRDAASGAGSVDLLICPPATLIGAAARLCQASALAIGAQDCHAEASGAHTGDISAEMLKDAGASHVIVGHSERRADHAEGDAQVRRKALAALRAGLTAIVCVGETLSRRDAGGAQEWVARQLRESWPEGATPDNLVVAYEPVWAIGSGRTPSLADVSAMHRALRAQIDELSQGAGARFKIIYGGSVKPDNAASLMAAPEVDGALVGGASLRAADFLAIAGVCRR